MDARLDFSGSEILQKFVKHLNAAAAAVPASVLPHRRRRRRRHRRGLGERGKAL